MIPRQESALANAPVGFWALVRIATLPVSLNYLLAGKRS